MSVYLDASVIVALFTEDLHSPAAVAVIEEGAALVVSDFAAAEFASAVAKKARSGALTEEGALGAFSDFDSWRVNWRTVETHSSDISLAASYLRCLDSTLRTPDAINIAICHRFGCRLSTFDRRMAEAAARLGVPT